MNASPGRENACRIYIRETNSKWSLIDRAIDLGFKTALGKVRFYFTGQDPFSHFDILRKAIDKALKKEKDTGIIAEFFIRCGKRLPGAKIVDHLSGKSVRIALDLDALEGLGCRVEQLMRHSGSGVEWVATRKISPSQLGSIPAFFEVGMPKGLRKISLSFDWTKNWGKGRAQLFVSELDAWMKRLNRKVGDQLPLYDFVNLYEGVPESVLSPSTALEPDGGLYPIGACLLEGALPELKEHSFLGELKSSMDPQTLESQSRGIRRSWAGLYEEGSARYRQLGAALQLAVSLDRYFKAPSPELIETSENPVIRGGLIGTGLIAQERFLRSMLPWLKSLFFFVRSGCLNDCIFCRKKVEDPGQTMEEISLFLGENERLKAKKIALVGNEPLLHPRIADIIRLCRKRGFMEIEVMTSGTLLREKSFARELVEAGVTTFAIPLYSAMPEEHDAITRRPGSFKEALSGIENLLSLAGARVCAHSNVTRQNLPALPGLEEFAARRLGLAFSMHPLRPKERDSMNLPYEALVPSYSHLEAALGGRVRSLTGFPVCVARRIQGDGLLPETEIADSLKFYILHQNFVKPASCKSCPQLGRCLGTFDAHLEAYPEDRRSLRL